MTVYEHAMLGATLALAVNAHRRHGWGLVAAAAAAGALPDWDGLSLALGPTAYADVHRVWGHNLLAAAVAGAVAGALGYLCHRSVRVRRAALRLLPPSASADTAPPPFAPHALAVWVTVGVVAALSHLPADLIYSGGAGLPDWPVPLLWPFSRCGYSFPLVPWGDLGVTLLFVGAMFALYRWPRSARAVATLTLAAGAAYLVLRGVVFPGGR
jgi:membrane-bound metal-dependent hydrolase YbcI (DUF457 family)